MMVMVVMGDLWDVVMLVMVVMGNLWDVVMMVMVPMGDLWDVVMMVLSHHSRLVDLHRGGGGYVLSSLC